MKTRQFILCFAILVGCNGESRVGNTVLRPGQPGMTTVDDENPIMLDALKSAKDTASEFVAALQNPRPGQMGFAVKKKFVDGNHTEFIWIGDVSHDGKMFHGRIQNDPVDISTVKLGQRVDVAPEDIADWMYVEQGRLKGGYTIRALGKILQGEELAEFKRQVPFDLD